jgi:hypothetical protein
MTWLRGRALCEGVAYARAGRVTPSRWRVRAGGTCRRATSRAAERGTYCQGARLSAMVSPWTTGQVSSQSLLRGLPWWP